MFYYSGNAEVPKLEPKTHVWLKRSLTAGLEMFFVFFALERRNIMKGRVLRNISIALPKCYFATGHWETVLLLKTTHTEAL